MRKILRAPGVAGLLLAAVLLCSLVLRVWGSGFGLPAYVRYHPDEHALVERAAQVLWTGDWNLGRFNYPPFYAYLNTVAYAFYFLYGVVQNLWRYVPDFVVPQYYLVGRLLTASVGVLTVLAVYLAGRQIRGRRAGLLAAALLGGNYLHVIHSHYATFDIMVGFLVVMTYLFSELVRATRETRWYVLAGLCAGLAGATKYNGAVVFILPLLAHVMATPWGEWGWLNGRLFLALGAFLFGFFAGNPFALGSLPAFLNDLATVLYHYGTEQPGFEGRGNWRWYGRVFLTSPDALWMVAGILGSAGLVWREWKKGLLLVAFPLIYFLLVSRFVVRFERNMVPVLPFLALGAGWLLDALANWLGRRLRERTRYGPLLSGLAAALGAVLLLALPVVAGVSLDWSLARTDHRELAGQWVEDNIAPGNRIAIEHYGIPFDYDQYQVEDVLRITNHDLDWYRQEGYSVLIVSDGVWPILRDQAEHYGDLVAAYDQLTAEAELMAEFVPRPPGLVVAGYPTVGVYHFAPVRIYRVPE